MKRRELEKHLESIGWRLVRITKHMIYSNGVKSVALSKDTEVALGTIRNVLTSIYGDREMAKKVMYSLRGR